MNHPDDGRTQPVIIFSKGREPQAALMNEKAYNKSVERQRLWTLHPETGRLVPFEAGGPLLSIRRKQGWFVAELANPEVNQHDPASGADLGNVDAESSAGTGRGDGRVGGHPAGPAGVGPSAGYSDSQRSGAPQEAEGESQAILSKLSSLIEERRRRLPEGSYTTHLFTQGSEKIRKKTGEEAVELLLARSDEELVYEAADLLYHLMVLLAAEELTIDDVLQELARRHT